MIAYIVRRLGILLVILFGSSFILFNLAAISGDPLADLRISRDPNAKQQMLNLIRDLHLNLPPPLRYFLWLKGILGGFVGHFDFGMSRDGQAVSTLIASAIPVTLRLISFATITAIVLGITIGIVTALRQYSRFDYAMTFVSFLLFSLPIFWVAVLLKEFMAIQFNNFLRSPTIPPAWLIGLSIFSGLLWAAILGGSRKRVWLIFIGVGILNAGLLTALSLSKWFLNPGFGPLTLFAIYVGIAFAITQLSVGLSNKPALKASLTMAVLGIFFYFPVQKIFDSENKLITFPLLVITTISLAFVTSFIFAKVDRGPTIRTTVISAILMAIFMIVDKLMHTWKPYMENDAINGRPVPTIGQTNALLEPGNYWLSTLDVVMHLILPTLALTAISFAGYIRYSRGTLLEVLNQDYIRSARAKGLTERTVIMRHAFRNTLIPLTTIIVVDLAGIVGGAIITERVFGWKGMGTLFNDAINRFDLNLLMGVFFLTASLAVLANLVADLLYSALDPRIRVNKQ